MKYGIWSKKHKAWVMSFYYTPEACQMKVTEKPTPWEGKYNPHQLINIYGGGDLTVKELPT